MTSRSRRRWPPPQVASHRLHSPQTPSRQSMAVDSWQPGGAGSPVEGLHGEVSFTAPRHDVPLPRLLTRMRRERRFTPSHVRVQPLHGDQRLHWQSMFLSQEMSALQDRVSRERPLAGLPHSLGSNSRARCRQVTPPPQLLEHWFHSSQAPHLPSKHCWRWQGCVWQGSSSSLGSASHIFPPARGARAMCRARLRWPPLHEQLQPLQSDQSPQRQSVSPQSGTGPPAAVKHARVSLMAAWQALPGP
mmetsp:Transcript_115322/g.367989  ORF Transcript_115322/g.367989 Transcript_115322/m.367989 type:complete len:246 (-) Transcript_115322:85-822(-)